jgi:hypothetical protein
MQNRNFGPPQDPNAERPIADLFADLARETSTLVRQEVQLAKLEMSHKAKQAGRSAVLAGAGGALAYAGLLALVAAAIVGLAAVIPLWLSALIVGLIAAGAGYGLLLAGVAGFKRIDPLPQQTIDTLKEDGTWTKQHLVP